MSDCESPRSRLNSIPISLNKVKIHLKKTKKFKDTIKRRIRILSWITKYDKSTFISDIIAGITLGLTMIPQSIAYAALANLPSHYGLYASFIGSFIYIIFGSIKEVSIGPTSLMALLTLQYTKDKPLEFVIILAFLAGVVEFVMGVLRLGFIVDFISMPVTSAFTSATSVIIIGTQIKSLLGLNIGSHDFLNTVYESFKHIANTKLGDGVLGLGCCLILIALRQMKDIPIPTTTKSGRFFKKLIWYVSIARNAIVVLIASVIAYNWSPEEKEIPFELSGKVVSGIPSFTLPPFSIQNGNTTYSFLEICSELKTGIIVVPLVAVLANIAIAKSFSSGNVVDASQEMISLGLCNIFGSFVQSMPTCGAFTRSAVSAASGVKTPMVGLYSGTMTLLALSLLTPYFYFIPKATLASVLICAVVYMIDFDIAIQLWHKNRRDFASWIICFTVGLVFGVEYGLLAGVVVNIMSLLFMWSRPIVKIRIEELDNIQYIRITPTLGMFYPGIDYIREKTNSAAASADYSVPVVVDCTKFTGLDYTAANGIGNLAGDLNKMKQRLILHNLDPSLQKFIHTSNDLLFCNKEETLREILTQEGILNGKIPLMQHIRASIDLGYKVEPLIKVESSDNIKCENTKL